MYAPSFNRTMKRVFKLILIIAVSMVIVLGTVEGDLVKAYDDMMVDLDVNGSKNDNVKAGEDIKIEININNASNLFAASFVYTYDNTLLKVDSIDVNEDIESAGAYPAYKDTAKDGNKARYCFTLLGENNGFSGDYNFVTIKGKALRDGQLNINEDNIYFQLIQKKNNEVINSDYHFKDSKGNIYKVTNVVEEKNNNSESNPDTSSSNNQSKTISGNGRSNVRIELVEKASNNESPENKTSNEKSSVNHNDGSDKEKNEAVINEDNESVDSNKDNNESISVDNKGKAGLLMFFSIVIIILLGVIFKYIKRRKRNL